MATYALIHGAGDVGWYWHLVDAELRARGHDVVAMDLPVEDDAAGLSDYADVVVDAIGDRGEMSSSWRIVRRLHGADRMQSRPVEAAGPCGGNGARRPGSRRRRCSPTPDTAGGAGDTSTLAVFYHDVPPALAAEAISRGRDAVGHAGEGALAAVSLAGRADAFLLCRNDRFFPATWLRGWCGSPRDHARRDRQRPLPGAQSARRAGRAAGGLPGRCTCVAVARAKGIA